jgi:hypothetical protein
MSKKSTAGVLETGSADSTSSPQPNCMSMGLNGVILFEIEAAAGRLAHDPDFVFSGDVNALERN